MLNWSFSKIEKMNITIKFYSFDFLDQINQKGYFYSKKKKENRHWILHIRISLGSKFQLQQASLSFGKNFQKKDTPSQKQKTWTSPSDSSYSN